MIAKLSLPAGFWTSQARAFDCGQNHYSLRNVNIKAFSYSRQNLRHHSSDCALRLCNDATAKTVAQSWARRSHSWTLVLRDHLPAVAPYSFPSPIERPIVEHGAVSTGISIIDKYDGSPWSWSTGWSCTRTMMVY